MGSYYGKNVRVSIFGQSHSPAIGVVIDGLPAGFPIDLKALDAFLARRAPGHSDLSTKRYEEDRIELLSGFADGVTAGSPFSAIIRNTNTRSADYAAHRDIPRPGHADFPAQVKYGGSQDVYGGGHFSGRLTAPLCIAGGIAIQMLEKQGVRVAAHVIQIGAAHDERFDPLNPQIDSLTGGYIRALTEDASRAMAAEIESARAVGDSVGGVIECAAIGMPVGVGEHMYEGLENRIAQAIFGIPAVKGLEFGSGFACAGMRGSEHNDPFAVVDGKVVTTSNNHGGILGGMSSGMPILFRAAFKPTSSIFQPQRTVSLSENKEISYAIKGRHDPCIVPRAVPPVESACALALLDALIDRKKEM